MDVVEKNKHIRSIKYRRWYCPTCDIFTNSSNQFNQHVEGIGHQYKMIKINNKATIQQEDYKFDPLFYIVVFIQIVFICFVFFYGLIKMFN